jgi:glycosyltransferase involved in cell wall biosynthesis
VRILIAHESAAGGGGVESYLAALVPALVQRGHAVALLHQRTRADAGPTRLQFAGVPAVSVEDEGFAAAFARLQDWAPDLAFSHNMRALAIEQALLERWPVVKMMHGFFGTCISSLKAHSFPSPAACTRVFGAACLALYGPRRCGPLRPVAAVRSLQWNARQHHLFDRYAAVVVASRYMQDEYVRHGIDRSRVVTAPLFPTTRLPVAPRERPVEPTVLFAGRMTPLKGPGVLVDAAAFAARALARPLRLVMAGEGPERLRLIDAAQKASLRASFPGWIPSGELTSLFRDATVVAVPSVWPEPFGLVGLEAAAHGVPAVAFDAGGISEWLHDGVSGRLVPPRGGAAAFGEALASVIDQPELLHTLERGALATAARMSLDAHVTTLEATFSAVRPLAGAR